MMLRGPGRLLQYVRLSVVSSSHLFLPLNKHKLILIEQIQEISCFDTVILPPIQITCHLFYRNSRTCGQSAGRPAHLGITHLHLNG